MDKVLLIEGFTDKKFFEHLRSDLTYLPQKPNGRDKALQALPEQINYLLNEDNNRLAIAVDADNDFNAIKIKMEVELDKHGFDIQTPIPAGSGVMYCYKQNNNIRVGVLIFPDHRNSGELETLLSTCADQTKLAVYSAFIDAQKLEKKEKSTIFCWLASNTHTCGFDNLFKENLIDINHASIQGIKTWLEEVYK